MLLILMCIFVQTGEIRENYNSNQHFKVTQTCHQFLLLGRCCLRRRLTRHPLSERYGLALIVFAAGRVDICHTQRCRVEMPK